MTDRPPLPDVVLERYRLGELPPGEADRIATRMREDAALRERIDALDRADEALRASGAIDAVAAGVRRRAGTHAHAPAAGRSLASYWIVPAIAAAAIAIVVFARTSPAPNSDSGADRIKGARPALALYRRTAGGSETLADGAVARQGDLVRVGYRGAGHAYGVIFSIDGRQTVTMHLPPDGDRAAPLGHDATVLLDRAYELDDAPRWERFYFVAGDAPFDVAPIVAAARRAPSAALALPRGLDQATFSLQKETRP
jgi:hypothetical protein